MGNAIFEDLDIDTDLMLTKPAAFIEQVYSAADTLRETLKADTSIAAITRRYEDSGTEADVSIHVLLNAVYTYADELSVEQMPAIIEASRKLTRDLEAAFRDRVIEDSSRNSKDVKDKKLAAALYKDLREMFNSYLQYMNMFFKKSLNGEVYKELPSMPGNYGNSTTGLKHYTFIIGDDEDNVYRQPAAVCRKLNLPVMHLYDEFLAYVVEHPELNIHVKEYM